MKVQVRCIFLIALILVCFGITAAAHSNSQDGILAEGYIGRNYNGYYIGGEDIGWAIMEDRHSGSTTIRYKFDASVSQEKRTYVRNGAQMWSGVANIVESSTASSIVYERDAGTQYIAAVYVPPEAIDPETGHAAWWEMYLNEFFDDVEGGVYAVDSITTAHEFGHTIGLTDLYTDDNYDKLMCGYEDYRTATAPTSSDLWGARVILGLHTTHTFTNYQYWGKDNNDTHWHETYCSDCGGKKAALSQCIIPVMDPMRSCIHCGHSLNQMKSLT